MSTIPPPVCPPSRVLMGPGPSEVPDRVLRVLGASTLGHLDPVYLTIMNQVRQMLQTVFRTKNEMTLAVSGTGSAGMEACVANLIEPGDTAIVCVNGVFGGRMKDVAERCGAKVHAVEVEWGRSIEPQMIADALKANPGAKFVGVVHAETSTGAHTPLPEISKLVHAAGSLLLVDAVTSLAGMDLRIDDWEIDACYSGTQKCISCPPGLSPVTLGPRATAVMDKRKHKVQSWYLDMTMVRQYWSQERVYHHTAPVNMTYALHEALRIVLEEGLDERVKRHDINHRALRAGLEALGLVYVPQRSLTTLNAVHVPVGVNDAAARTKLLADYGIEIGGGLGLFKGKAWRIGLMGSSSSKRNVLLVLSAIESILADQGVAAGKGQALAAAGRVFREQA